MDNMDIEFLFVSSVGQKGKDNEDKFERGINSLTLVDVLKLR